MMQGLAFREEGDHLRISAEGIDRKVRLQSLLRDHSDFEIRIQSWSQLLQPGLTFSASTVELGRRRFTNSFEIRANLGAIAVHLVTTRRASSLCEIAMSNVSTGKVLALTNGTFSCLSDDASYLPCEPSLDFCSRSGEIVSLPTVDKAALVICDGQPRILRLHARGLLSINNRSFTWIGSKQAGRTPVDNEPELQVFGTANCRIRYADHTSWGRLRYISREDGLTPLQPDALDIVVRDAGTGLKVVSMKPGGGCDLFEGNFILRAPLRLLDRVKVGHAVDVHTIDGFDASRISEGFSIGPSIAEAARNNHFGYDESLGESPFLAARRAARTLVSMTADTLVVRVFDGAPRSRRFLGLSPQEIFKLLRLEACDVHQVYYLDGGNSSKMLIARDRGFAAFANMHYLKYPAVAGERLRWKGHCGRALNSAIVFATRH